MSDESQQQKKMLSKGSPKYFNYLQATQLTHKFDHLQNFNFNLLQLAWDKTEEVILFTTDIKQDIPEHSFHHWIKKNKKLHFQNRLNRGVNYFEIKFSRDIGQFLGTSK